MQNSESENRALDGNKDKKDKKEKEEEAPPPPLFRIEIDVNQANDLIEEIKRDDQKLFEYARAFYWTFTSYFSVYDEFNTEMIKNKRKIQDPSSATPLIQMGLNKMNEFAKYPFPTLPQANSVVLQSDIILDKIQLERPLDRLKPRTLTVNKVLQFTREPNQSVQKDLHLATCFALEQTVKVRREFIMNPVRTFAETGLFGKAYKWFVNELQSMKEQVCLERDSDLYNSESAMLGLEEGVLMIINFVKYSEKTVNNRTQSFAQQLAHVLTKDRQKGVLYDVKPETLKMDGSQQKGGCCIIQ